ncbi:MAG: protein kinase [Cyanophyceae cyanobacterium]
MTLDCPSCLTANSDNSQSCISCGTPLELSSSTYHLPTGTLLKQGHYRIEKVIGDGGFGITYQGTDLTNAGTVALKELWPEKAVRQGTSVTWPHAIAPKERQQQLTKFKLEASYLHQCRHPHIVKVYDWFDENDTAYIVMEFVAGETLYSIFKREGRVSEERVKRYFIQVAEALKVVHGNNFLHRDLKPENIIIDGQDRAVLIDFGATKEFIAGQTRELSVTLTKGYAPLEQYSYKSKRWAATDIYALCASMYEVLTGELPADPVVRVHSDSLIPPRQLRSDLSELIEKVVLTGLQMRVEDRFQSADELINALEGKLISPIQKRAQELAKQLRLAEAVQAYEKCLSYEPSNGEAAVELALVQIHLDESQAEAAAQKAIQLKPNDGRSYGVLGLISCRQAQWLVAVSQLQQAASLSSQEAWIQTNLAWALGKSGNWQQAEVAVAKSLQIDSRCTFALGIQAWIAANQQQWKPAIRAATQAVFKSKAAQSRNSQALQQWIYPLLIIALDKAVVTKQARDVDRRIEEFITQLPNSAWGWGFKGWKQAKQGLWSDAQTSFEQANSQAQVPSWLLINRGVTQERLNNPQGAIQAYEEHAQKFSPNPLVLFRLGTLWGRSGYWTQARLCLEKAVQLKSHYAQAQHNLGWVLLNIKTSNGKIENFREILLAYRSAADLYAQQQKLNLAQAIERAFLEVEIKL